MNRPFPYILTAALGLSLAATTSFGQGGPGGGGQLYANGLLIQPLGGAPAFQGANERTAEFLCFDNTLTQGVQIPCDSDGGAQCTVGMIPVLSTPGARLKVWQLMQGQSGTSAMSHVTVTSVAGGSAECVADFSALSATSVEVVVRDRYGKELARATCASGVCACIITDSGGSGGGGGGGGWTFSATNKTGYNVKSCIKARMLSGSATVSGVGPVVIANAGSVEFCPIICITEPCPTSWPHMSALQVTAGNGGAPVALPIDVSNPALCSFSWGVSNPTYSGQSGGKGSGRAASWGSGGATITEGCPGSGTCPTTSRELHIAGLDDSGTRSATVDFDPDELDAEQTRDFLYGKFADARSVSFQVAPVALAPGQTSGTVDCRVMGRNSLSGPAGLRYLFGLTGTALTTNALHCSAGPASQFCSLRALSPTGAVLASAIVSASDNVTFPTGAPWPVVTIDPTDACTFDCSSAGTVSCVMPSGTPVSGVTALEFRPLSPTVGIGCDQLSVSGTHIPEVKLVVRKVVNPLYMSGLPVSPKNDWPNKVYDSVTDTLSWTPPALDPVGNPSGGVSLIYGTKNAVACDIDLDSCLNTPGAKLRIRHKGWDGLIYGNHRVTGGGGGHGSVACDFSDQGALSVHFVVRDSIGAVLAQGDIPGALANCAVDTTCCGGPPPPGGGTDWSVSCGKGNWNLKENNKRTAAFTVTGLTPSPITGAAEIAFTRIVCITAPCPGDGTPMAAMEIDGGGMPVVKIASVGVTMTNSVGTSTVVSGGRREIHVTANGPAVAFPVCSAGGCDAPNEALCLTNLGVPDVSTYHAEFSEAQSTVFCSCKSDCSADFAGPGGDDHPIESLSFFCAPQDALTDGLLIMRFTLAPDPATGSAALSFDGSGRGSTECLVECLSSDGAVLNARNVANFDAMQCVGAVSPSGHLAYIGTCDASGACTVSPFATTGQCIVSGGQVVSNVAKIRCKPISPTYPPSPILSVAKEVKCVRNSDTSVSADFSVAHAGGLPLSPIGAAVLTPTTDGVDVTNLSCAGTDGVRIGLNTGNGGQIGIPIGELFAGPQPCGGPRIRIKHLAWDGSVAAGTELFRVTGGGALTETYQALGGSVVSLDITLFSASGAELARVTRAGSVATWTDVAEGNSATVNKVYQCAAMRDAHEGFFDFTGKRTVTVTGLTASPIPGVHAIRCLPIYAPGTVAPRQLAALEVTGHSISKISIRDPQRVRAVAGSNYPPPDRFLGALGSGTAIVSERCASIYPCPWDTQELVVSNIGSSGQNGVRLRAFFENGDIPDSTNFSVSGCGSWGETGGPPILSSMDVSFGHTRPFDGHVTVLKLHSRPSSSNTPVQYAEDYYCDASGFGSPTTIVRVYSAAGLLLDSAVVGPSDPIHASYCNTQQMPTFSNHGNECALQLPSIGQPCYTVTLPGHSPMSAGKVTFNPFTITRVVEPINEVMFTGAGLQDIVLGSVHMEFPPACLADMGVQGGTPGQDGLLNNNDFVVFINFFFTGDLRADVGVQGGTVGQDGLLNNNDFVAFINLFFSGCP